MQAIHKQFDPIWIPCNSAQPEEDGIYMVTTVNGHIRLDRFVGGVWGLCKPRPSNATYRMHRAWTRLPEPYNK